MYSDAALCTKPEPTTGKQKNTQNNNWLDPLEKDKANRVRCMGVIILFSFLWKDSTSVHGV